jgi:alkylhydroperoxidase family enzyme
MARARLVFEPQHLPEPAGRADRVALNQLLERMHGLFGVREIPRTAAGFAIAARAPKLALLLAELSEYMVRDCDWTARRTDLRELSIQVLNQHFNCDYNFQSHLAKAAQHFGLPLELQAAIPLWRTSTIFTAEQRLVIEYTLAAIQGAVTDALFERVGAQFGETGAVELTIGIAWWSFWAILVGAIGPEHDFGYGTAAGAPV